MTHHVASANIVAYVGVTADKPLRWHSIILTPIDEHTILNPTHSLGFVWYPEIRLFILVIR